MPFADVELQTPLLEVTEESSHEDLLQMGLIYSTGLGVEEDFIEAHKWFNLAALRGNEDAKVYRKDMAEQMSSEEISEAQKSARMWLSLMN